MRARGFAPRPHASRSVADGAGERWRASRRHAGQARAHVLRPASRHRTWSKVRLSSSRTCVSTSPPTLSSNACGAQRSASRANQPRPAPPLAARALPFLSTAHHPLRQTTPQPCGCSEPRTRWSSAEGVWADSATNWATDWSTTSASRGGRNSRCSPPPSPPPLASAAPRPGNPSPSPPPPPSSDSCGCGHGKRTRARLWAREAASCPLARGRYEACAASRCQQGGSSASHVRGASTHAPTRRAAQTPAHPAPLSGSTNAAAPQSARPAHGARTRHACGSASARSSAARAACFSVATHASWNAGSPHTAPSAPPGSSASGSGAWCGPSAAPAEPAATIPAGGSGAPRKGASSRSKASMASTCAAHSAPAGGAGAGGRGVRVWLGSDAAPALRGAWASPGRRTPWDPQRRAATGADCGTAGWEGGPGAAAWLRSGRVQLGTCKVRCVAELGSAGARREGAHMLGPPGRGRYARPPTPRPRRAAAPSAAPPASTQSRAKGVEERTPHRSPCDAACVAHPSCPVWPCS